MGCKQTHGCREGRPSKSANFRPICASNILCEYKVKNPSAVGHQNVMDSSVPQRKCKRNTDDDAVPNSRTARDTSPRYKLVTSKPLMRYPSNQQPPSQSLPSCTTSHSGVDSEGPPPREPFESRDGKKLFTDVNSEAFLRATSMSDTEVYDSFVSDGSDSSNTPQLFHIGPTRRAEERYGTWEWWYEQIEQLRLTKDYLCRTKLQDIPNRLARQYELDKCQVELDMGWCYMERSAPYVIGRLLASPFLNEIRLITALRLDGNYFTDEGFGNMLAVMCEANRYRPTLPLLRYLYLNNMNLDPCSVKGILFYLFPTDLDRLNPKIAGEAIGLPSEAYATSGIAPRTPLFPSLEVLSLCDNPGIGNQGLAELLRCFIAYHFEKRSLSVVDLSRCSLDEVGVQYLREYLALLPNMLERMESIVFVARFVLIGNRHSIDRSSEVCSTEDVTLVL